MSQQQNVRPNGWLQTPRPVTHPNRNRNRSITDCDLQVRNGGAVNRRLGRWLVSIYKSYIKFDINARQLQDF